jgi:signal transduction histidine kinase
VPIGRIALLAVAYALTARLGLMMDAVAGFATLVWAPSGIALAALLRGGRRLWPGVFIGAFVVNAWVGAPPLVAAGIATGNTLEAVLGAAALSHIGLDPRLERVKDVAWLILSGAVASTVASATIGVASLYAGGIVSSSGLGSTWRAWWVGDAIGDMVVAPLLLVWSSAPRRRGPWTRVAEGAAVCAVAAGTGLAVFGGSQLLGVASLYAPLVWAAVRLRQRGSTLVVLVVSACAIAGTALGHGPFVHAQLHRSLLELQSFMGFATSVTLLLAAAVAERDHARAIALEALKGRDDFIAIASHELRTPLSALTLQLGTMRRRITKGGTVPDTDVSRAERQSDRLSNLVSTLLDLSRVESGQLRVNREPMDLAELVRSVVDHCAAEAQQAQCPLRVEAPTSVNGAWDRLRIEQVLSNLLSNAFRYAAGKPVDVTLTADERVARLAVRDHGAGVPEKQVESLFQRYRRGDAVRERGGLGLGLYVARHLIEAHGGTLRAHGNPGSGCEFVFELPLRAGYTVGHEPAGARGGAAPRRG